MVTKPEGSSKDCPILIDSPLSSKSGRSPMKVSARASDYRQVIQELDSDSNESSYSEEPVPPSHYEEPTLASHQCAERSENEPVYEIPPEKYAAEDIVRILLNPKIDEQRICKQRPLDIQKSGTFVVDLDSLQHPDDVKKDNFGTWTHSGSHDQKFESRINAAGNLEIGKPLFSTESDWEQFSLRRLHSKHPTNAKFRRIISFITDSKGSPHHLCMLTYYIPSGFKPYALPHGNSKSCKPFHPTWPSTLELVKKEGSCSGPKEVIARVSERVGGVMGASAPGQLPRGEMQVSNAKRHLQFKVGCDGSDELFIMMQKAKTEDPFIRDIKTTPDPAIVACTDQQLDDLVRFCAPPAGINCSILTVDPTFCLGEFECTPVTYRHLLLVTRRYGTPPVFLGPVLIHYRKNFATFLFFASSLVGLRRPLEGIRVFGTDGETALVDAFTHEFRFSIHLYCFNHVRSNVKRELQERNFPENEVSEILEIIFGKLVGGTFSEGLVDAESVPVFYEKLEEFKSTMTEKEKQNPASRPGFYEWLCRYKADNIVSGMLKPVREEAGLGLPPSSFTTNACESINAMLKRKVEYKKNELPTFMNHLKQLAEEQEREVERAVIGRGKYKFVEEYKCLEISETDWFRMSREQRKKHMHKVSTVQLAFTSGIPGDIEQLSSNSESMSTTAQLSVRPEDFHSGLKIPLAAIQGIWKKAEELLSDPNAISPAPGYDSRCKMVMSRSGKRPHLVTCTKQGKYTCDSECPNWKSMNICSHSVAVAQVSNSLQEFCNLYRKSKHLPSVTRLVLTGVSSGVGRKGNRVCRKRKREPECTRIPLTPSIASAVSATASLESPPGPSHSSISAQSAQFMHWNTNKRDLISTGRAEPRPGSSHSSFAPADSVPFMPAMQWSTYQGDIHVQSPSQWNSPYSSYQQLSFPSGYDNRQPEVFRLCFRVGNISVCNGCRNKFDKQAKPPNDLCVQHEEWRSYTSPVSQLPESRFGNAYYHANPHCILARWPQFSPGELLVPDDIRNRLTSQHKALVSNLFGVYF